MRLALIGPELEENLALRYIHAAVVAAGHEAVIFDFHEPAQIAQLVKDILAYAPDAVGLSMVFTARGREYADLARSLRSAGYAGHITAGGHFASFHADLLLRDVPAIDSILHGEGEAAAVDLLDHLAQPSLVAGVSCRDGAGGVISTPPRPPVDNLDDLPFPTRSPQFQDYFGLPIANILSGRGCFADCAFCSINAWHRRIGGRRFRQRSVENLADEMACLYHDHGVRLFNFHDDNFFLPTEAQNGERFGAIRDALVRRNVGRIGIQVKARPDTVEPESMRILKEIGLFRVFLGVESNAVAGLKALNRGITCQRNGRALALLKGLDLHVTFNLLMFEPDCTIADLRDNIAFIREQYDVPLNFCRTEIYTGTALEKRLRDAERLEGDYWGYGYTMRDPSAQLAYEMFRVAFSPRNFELDGMNLRAMAADYYFHVLRHFHPQLASPNVKKKVVDLIGQLNANNAELLTCICDFAQSADPTDTAAVDRFTQDLCARRIAFDVRMEPRFSGILHHMRQLAAGQSVRPGTAVRAAATAATALLATVLGCGKETQSTEMAPPDRTSRPAPPNDSARLPMTYSTEMVARPPATRPASQPATTRATSGNIQTHSTEMAPRKLDDR